MRIGNVELKEVKQKYGTPLYIYDEGHLLKNMRDYKSTFKSNEFETEILYASKAFCVKEMLRLVKNEGLSLDVVSIGELYTAKAVDFDMKKIYFHGNNKSISDLEIALSLGVGTIVVDNLMELEALEVVAKKLNVVANIIIRINCGVEAHTHKFIVTGHVDSKFGVIYNSPDFLKMKEILAKTENIKLLGFHSHIGSQIFDLDAFKAALDKLISIAKDYSYPLVLNIGGGFGVKYTNEDKPIPFDKVSAFLVKEAELQLKNNGVKLKKLCIEPGRSIVAEAGYTLYEVGYIKKTPNKLYYFIDGGMTDNIRPALYQAKYDCDIDGKENEPKTNVVTIAGKCCESGDLIIENALLPNAVPGDLLITYTTGAYGYSMSSNYNKALTPAVVFVNEGNSKLVVRRMTYEDLLAREE